jgi:Mg2+-importing ATPase
MLYWKLMSDVSPEGLREDEARIRLNRFGPNTLAEQRHVSLIERFLRKLLNPLILLLLVAGLLSALFKQISDLIIICVITFVSIVMDMFQEVTAEGAAEKLRKRVSLTATVLRDGVKKEVPLTSIVPGDIIYLSVGDIVPADAKLVTASDLLIDESTLTGESYPKEKTVATMALMGTNVVTGEGEAVVTVTGKNTQIGKISSHLVAPRPKTEFEKGISEFGLFLMKTAIVFGIFVFLTHVFLAHELLTSALFVLALIIGIAPEMLPMIITVNLSRGAIRMSKRGVIVKSLPSIEDFGSMDILCTDKTGTLTENKIVLERYEDGLGASSDTVLQYGYIGSVFQSGFRGPMEEAILAHKEAARHGFIRVDVIPFDFFRKRVSVVVTKNQKRLLITKGAPEDIIHISTVTPAARKGLLKRLDGYGQQGFRVLGVAYKEVPNKKSYDAKDETGLTFLGFMVFLDPPKKTVIDALKRLAYHHVSIKILTGDNDVVTSTICKQIGLSVLGVVKSEDIEHASDAELRRLVEKNTIFSRLNPDLKVRVISAIRANGHVVGYMGDGINDAPSLRAADIGISVNNASDVAKLSADIILLHKDLHVLLDGVAEGRVTFGNVIKYLKMNTSSDFGTMVSIAVASVLLPFLPMLPVQILLNDLLYDVSQLTLAGDRVDEASLVVPHKWNVRSIRKFMYVFGPANSLFDLLTFGILLWLFHASVPLFQTGWFLENIVAQTIIVFSIRTAVVPFYKSHTSHVFTLSLLAIVVVALLLPFTPLASAFSFVRPPPVFFIVLVGLVAAYIMFAEALKQWFYKMSDV